MADDARTEARRRITEALTAHRLVGAFCACGEVANPEGGRSHADHQVDELLFELFPDATWRTTWTNGNLTFPADRGRATNRQLVLTAPVEPVTEEVWTGPWVEVTDPDESNVPAGDASEEPSA